MLVVDSHRDLDRKNVLSGKDGLIALDWDAAGAVCAAQEIVAVALDWAGLQPGPFRAAVADYRAAACIDVPAEPWVFGGWVAGQGEWLDYNAAYRYESKLGRTEVMTTRKRLQELATSIDPLVEALRWICR